MLSIHNLNAGYEELKVLKNVDLEFQMGEFVSIIGPNGAGKSTVLKSIFNIATLEKGSSIKFEDKELVGLKPYQLIFEGVAYVPQGRINFADLTVEENLLIGNYYLKDKKVSEQNLEKVYKFFPELHKFKKKLSYALSGGQQQMLAIGRAMMLDPKVLLLDEPSLGLSPKLIKETFAKIKEIAESGVLVLMVEQNAKKAMECTDKTVVLEGGELKLFGKSKDLLKDPKLGKVFFGGE
ncbi:MAG: ABC transporter ATP-binding protein [Candidatus ainarchaeum sp.]|nr:ABC transporter ATP-binding protein [Candidatus ainarchaeum sp.]